MLTDVGRTALRYADDIFRTGRELQQALRGVPTGGRVRLVVGVADVIPKRMAEALLEPAVEAVPQLALLCREAPVHQLLAALALHEVDVVLSDAPLSHDIKVKAYSHPLGEGGVSFLATPALGRLAAGFPASLDGAPALLPSKGTALRRALEGWFDARGVVPELAGEFDDSALLEAFGARGLGFFAVPTVIEGEVCAANGFTVIGRAAEVRAGFFAITVERRLRHPGVAAIVERRPRGEAARGRGGVSS